MVWLLGGGGVLGGVLFEEVVDVLDVVERVVEVECQLGYLAELQAHFLPQLVADGFGTLLEVFKNFLRFCRREDRQVDLRDGEVGRDSHGRHRDDDAVGFGGLKPQYLAYFFLNEACYLCLLYTSRCV